MNTPQRGFTLIELLVVISIIGLLASIVLASLSAARANASDAAVKSEVKEAAAQVELDYSGSGYGATFPSAQCPTLGATVFVEPKLQALIAAAAAASGVNWVKCAAGGNDPANASSWAIAAPLQARGLLFGIDGQYWCTDSTGNTKLSMVHESWYEFALSILTPKAFAAAGPPGHGPPLGGGTGSIASCP